MEVFYEETAIYKNENLARKRYVVSFITALVFFVFAFLALILVLFSPTNMVIVPIVFLVLFLGLGIFFFIKRNRYKIDYDYTFVSGSLRISKVFNSVKRKLILKCESESVLGIGKYNNESFIRHKSNPMNKVVMAVANKEREEDFYYILCRDNGVNTLFVLECSKKLIDNILFFTGKMIADRDIL